VGSTHLFGVEDAVNALSFSAQLANRGNIAAALGRIRTQLHDILELDYRTCRVRKTEPVTLDLSGIANGYAVDQMMAVLKQLKTTDALVSLDGKISVSRERPGGLPWTGALERPEYEVRTPLSVVALHNAANATSGVYRHWVDVGNRRLSHSMEPQCGGLLIDSPAAITVMSSACMRAMTVKT
jgi:thiamine biosynthesis lipoprotein